MATRNDPGPVDCYARLEPDEPYYLLMARSRLAPLHARMELMNRQWEMRLGLRPDTPEERAQVTEGLKCVTQMEIWYREHEAAKAMAAARCDAGGVPTQGPHARKERNSTSGANDT
jgi:hypothetical protein